MTMSAPPKPPPLRPGPKRRKPGVAARPSVDQTNNIANDNRAEPPEPQPSAQNPDRPSGSSAESLLTALGASHGEGE